MERPLAVAGCVYLAAQLTAVLCGNTVSVTLFAVCVLLFALSFLTRSDSLKTLRMILLCAAVSFGSFSAYDLITVRPARSLEGITARITGRLIEQPARSDGRYYYYVDTESITPEGVSLRGVPQNTRIRLSSAVGSEAETDDIISCRVTFNRTDGASFSSVSVRLKARGVMATGYIERYGGEITVTEGRPSIYGRIARLRTRIKRRISAMFGGEYSALLSGMLLGDKSDMDSALVRKFRRSGISHYLAVSGLHLSLFCLITERLLLLCRVGLRKRSAAMPLFILFFMALTGFSASVIRAGIMYGFYYMARAVMRDSDSLNSLGASVLVMCFLFPYAAADAGMLMSASAALGLITAAPVLERRIMKRVIIHVPESLREAVRGLISAAVTSFVASVSVFPVSALYFGEVSLVAVPCNVCCLYPAYFFMLFGALAAPAGAVPLIGRYLGFIIGIPAKASGWLLIKLAGLFASPSWASLNVNYRCLPAAFIAAASVSALAWLMYRKSGGKAVSRAVSVSTAVSLALSCVCVCTESVISKSTAEICVFDAGGGIVCFAEKGGNNVLLCTGCDDYRLWLMSERLDKMKLNTLDALVVTDDSGSGYPCAEYIAGQYRPERIYVPERVVDEWAEGKPGEDTGSMFFPISSGGIRYSSGGDNIRLELITDPQGLPWYWINAGGLTALIAPDGGDCSRLSGKLRTPDIVIVSSDDLIGLSSLKAKAVIVSADDKEASGTEALLRYRGIENICAVPADGSVRITRHNDGIKAEELN